VGYYNQPEANRGTDCQFVARAIESLKILITGICGFVGSTLAEGLREHSGTQVIGIDNCVRSGSELNRSRLRRLGVRVFHGDLRNPSDLESLPPCDWIIDAAANPSVLAGVDGKTSSRQMLEHNLVGTINILELAKAWKAGFVMLSTSRVYSVKPLAALPIAVSKDRFVPKPAALKITGFSRLGISESFSTEPPISLYGSSKLASEVLALEYAETFNLPIFVNRCGVLAGAGQFGKADQGIFSYWIHAYCQKRPLRYIGFDGAGHQVRDCLHPRDLVLLLSKQMKGNNAAPRIVNVSGGLEQSASLRELSEWCADRFGPHSIQSQPANRPFDVPWLALDSRKALAVWKWKPVTQMHDVWSEIAAHAEQNPHWLDLSIDT
jgi:CDP-paratose 2-epimerase